MPIFQYKALQADGQITEGQFEAGGRQEAFRQMESRGWRPISLTENRNGKRNGKVRATSAPAVAAEKNGGFNLSLGGAKRIPARVLENFTRLLSSLLAAGVPLSRALVILQKEAAHPTAREKWKEVHDLVVDGMSLADAMAKSPGVFPRVYVAMVRRAKPAGFSTWCRRRSRISRRAKEMRGKVLTALLYPTILLVLALWVLAFCWCSSFPFSKLFAGFNAKLPLLTR